MGRPRTNKPSQQRDAGTAENWGWLLPARCVRSIRPADQRARLSPGTQEKSRHRGPDWNFQERVPGPTVVSQGLQASGTGGGLGHANTQPMGGCPHGRSGEKATRESETPGPAAASAGRLTHIARRTREQDRIQEGRETHAQTAPKPGSAEPPPRLIYQKCSAWFALRSWRSHENGARFSIAEDSCWRWTVPVPPGPWHHGTPSPGIRHGGISPDSLTFRIFPDLTMSRSSQDPPAPSCRSGSAPWRAWSDVCR